MHVDFLTSREGSLKIGDRILAINDYNVAHFSLSEASVFLQQSGREVSLLVEYDVSLMGEHHRLETSTQSVYIKILVFSKMIDKD